MKNKRQWGQRKSIRSQVERKIKENCIKQGRVKKQKGEEKKPPQISVKLKGK